MLRLLTGLVSAMLLVGCHSEQATVRFSYVVTQHKGLPQGVNTLIIHPSVVGPNTDPMWSDLAADLIMSLVNESRSEFGTPVTVSERRDAKAVFDEADLAAAGMSTARGGRDPQLRAAEAAILSNINVKVEQARGRARTISGLDLSGFGSRHSGGGHVGVETSEVDTYSRHMTVQMSFKLMDLHNGVQWDYYQPRAYSQTENTKVSPFFGTSGSAANLTREDKIVGTLVEQAAQEFVSRLMPCRIEVNADVQSSSNADCAEGVRRLRAQDYEGALGSFQRALAANGRDHRAAYGAGLACEAMGDGEEALGYYREACAGEDDPRYAEARDRMNAYGSRIRG
jgi:hypothetical protein